MNKTKITLLFLAFILLLGSCTGAGTYKALFDKDIDEQISSKITELDNIILQAILDNDTESAKSLFSGELIDSGIDIESLFSEIRAHEEGRNHERYKNVYVKMDRVGEHRPVVAESLNDENGMIITFSGYTKEMYVSMIKSTDESSENLFYIEYIKQKGQWQVYRLNYGSLTRFGMDANDIYQKSRTLYGEGYDIPAALYSDAFDVLIKPVPYIQYKNEEMMVNFFDGLKEEVSLNYEFPVELSENSGKQIYSIELRALKQGYVPIINYVTQTQLGDANQEKLLNEAYSINAEIDEVFPGFAKSFDYFLYKAFNEPPLNQEKDYASYASIVEKGVFR
jgi:hypothetical protein